MQPGRVPRPGQEGAHREGAPFALPDAARRLESAHAHTTRHPRAPRLRARPGHRQLAGRHGRPHGAGGRAGAGAAVGGAEARLRGAERGREGQRRRRPGLQPHLRGRRRRARPVDLRGQRALGRGGRDRDRLLGQGRREGHAHHAAHRRRQGLRDGAGRRRDRPGVRATRGRRGEHRRRRRGQHDAGRQRQGRRQGPVGNGQVTWVFDSEDKAHEFAQIVANKARDAALDTNPITGIGRRIIGVGEDRPIPAPSIFGLEGGARIFGDAEGGAGPLSGKAEGEIGPSIGGRYDTRTNQTTVYFKLNASGKAGGELVKTIGGRGLGEAELQLAVTVDSQRPADQGDGHRLGHGQRASSPASWPASSGKPGVVGKRADVRLDLDLTDPANRQAFTNFVQDPVRRHPRSRRAASPTTRRSACACTTPARPTWASRPTARSRMSSLVSTSVVITRRQTSSLRTTTTARQGASCRGSSASVDDGDDRGFGGAVPLAGCGGGGDDKAGASTPKGFQSTKTDDFSLALPSGWTVDQKTEQGGQGVFVEARPPGATSTAPSCASPRRATTSPTSTARCSLAEGEIPVRRPGATRVVSKPIDVPGAADARRDRVDGAGRRRDRRRRGSSPCSRWAPTRTLVNLSMGVSREPGRRRAHRRRRALAAGRLAWAPTATSRCSARPATAAGSLRGIGAGAGAMIAAVLVAMVFVTAFIGDAGQGWAERGTLTAVLFTALWAVAAAARGRHRRVAGGRARRARTPRRRASPARSGRCC